MGNTSSNVTTGVKKQADSRSLTIYELTDLKGGGQLVHLMKKAIKTKNYAEVDDAIRTRVEPYLYNKGEGKLVPISELVLMRNKDRPKHKQIQVGKNNNPSSDTSKNCSNQSISEIISSTANINGDVNFKPKGKSTYLNISFDNNSESNRLNCKPLEKKSSEI